MALLKRSKIVEKTQGYKTAEVEVPEWGEPGDYVIVRELTAQEVTKIGVAAIESEGGEISKAAIRLEQVADVMPQIVAWTVVDENLVPMLTLADVLAMTSENMEVINRLGTKALELSDLTEEIPDEDETQDPNS